MIVGAMKMWSGLLFCVAVTAASGPGSCESRCGQMFSRTQVCSCDSDCQLHGDCCHDYEEACINGGAVERPSGEVVSVIVTPTALATTPVVMTTLNNVATPPRSVTDVLGVPAPVDTVFTRCNCEAKTYVIKGELYWVLDRHLVPESRVPQRVSAGFSGLTGVITAALPLPASRAAPETVYFFKKGGFMQKYSFPADALPSCIEKPLYSRQRPRLADVFLSGEINMAAVSLKGFPALVTSALSSPSAAQSSAYNHFRPSPPSQLLQSLAAMCSLNLSEVLISAAHC
ncbi:hypothetical protein CRUP_030603 [Coryphaenoides rupestris]|nr:hypothetical protein CRUP_030603 [Coryphaenoides rupestris]